MDATTKHKGSCIHMLHYYHHYTSGVFYVCTKNTSLLAKNTLYYRKSTYSIAYVLQ